MQVEDRFFEMLAQFSEKALDPKQIRRGDELSSLGIDSLGFMEVVFEVEEAFDVEVPVESLPELKTVGGVLELLEEQLGSTAA